MQSQQTYRPRIYQSFSQPVTIYIGRFLDSHISIPFPRSLPPTPRIIPTEPAIPSTSPGLVPTSTVLTEVPSK